MVFCDDRILAADAKFKFSQRNRGNDDIADKALRKAFADLGRLMLHEINANVGVEHLFRTHKASRSSSTLSSR